MIIYSSKGFFPRGPVARPLDQRTTSNKTNSGGNAERGRWAEEGKLWLLSHCARLGPADDIH